MTPALAYQRHVGTRVRPNASRSIAILIAGACLILSCDRPVDADSNEHVGTESTTRPDLDEGASPAGESSTANEVAGQPDGSAFLTITQFDLSSQAITRNQPLTARVRVENRGDAPSGSFEVEVRVIVETPTNTTSRPLGSGGRLNLAVGAGADFTFGSESAHLDLPPGVHRVTVAFLKTDGQYSNPKDRYDSNVQERRLVVS
jgi:hypothetical protein